MKVKNILPAIFNLAIILAFPLCSAEVGFTAKVIGVSDGDSITVLKDKEQIKIRLAHIDCPEG